MKKKLFLILILIQILVNISGSKKNNFKLNKTLLKAALNGKIEEIKKTIENGADVNVKNNKGETVLDKAKIENNTEIINILKEAGAKKGSELK